MKHFWTIAAALLLVACTPMQWVKTDAAPEQTQADAKECQMNAWQEARWRSFSYYGMGPFLYRDRFGRPFAAPYGPFGDPFGDRFMDESRLAHFCMRSKGYELQEVPKR
jgi:hypothetical protein